MLFQQIIALVIITLFLAKIIIQKRKNQINKTEFFFWLFFWFISFLAIVLIKEIDIVLESIGVSASGINFIVYLSVLFLFYLIFKLRLSVAKLDRELTNLNRKIAISEVRKVHKSNDNQE